VKELNKVIYIMLMFGSFIINAQTTKRNLTLKLDSILLSKLKFSDVIILENKGSLKLKIPKGKFTVLTQMIDFEDERKPEKISKNIYSVGKSFY